jgi:hypothetical protein
MLNPEQSLSIEDQWELLVEYGHGHGLALGFHALWVEGDDQEELARLFRVDPGTRVNCDAATLAGTYSGPPTTGIWVGSHAPGWTHIFAFGMPLSHPALSNLGKRRVFQMRFAGETGEGLEPLYLDYDGESVGEIYLPSEDGGYMALPEYRPFTTGLVSNEDATLEQDVHLMWCLVGRITGRFADRDWWTAIRSYYRIPDEAWVD